MYTRFSYTLSVLGFITPYAEVWTRWQEFYLSASVMFMVKTKHLNEEKVFLSSLHPFQKVKMELEGGQKGSIWMFKPPSELCNWMQALDFPIYQTVMLIKILS